MKWTLPNILTVFRLLSAPLVAAVFVLFYRPAADWIALALFVAASITDYIDGYLARAWNQGTKMGTMLDPIADKAMVLIALMVIVGTATPDMTYALMFPAGLILFREVFVSGLREFLGDVAGTLKVTKLAKWKTTAQMVALTELFVAGIYGFPALQWLGLGLLWLAAALTVLSGLDYFTKALPFLKEEDA